MASRWPPLSAGGVPTALFRPYEKFVVFIAQESARKCISDVQPASVLTAGRVSSAWHSNSCKVYPFCILLNSSATHRRHDPRSQRRPVERRRCTFLSYEDHKLLTWPKQGARKCISDAQPASVLTSGRVFCAWHSNSCKVYPFRIFLAFAKLKSCPMCIAFQSHCRVHCIPSH